MHALFGVGGVAVHLRVEAFDKEAVGFALGDDGAVGGDVIEAGFVVADGDLGELFAQLGGFDVLVVSEVGFFIRDVGVGAGRLGTVVALELAFAGRAGVEELDGFGFGLFFGRCLFFLVFGDGGYVEAGVDTVAGDFAALLLF